MSPITATELLWKLSGGAANANVNAALGGAMSTTQIVDATNNNLFDDVSGAESAAGSVEYRGFYIHNNHGSLTLQDARAFISSLTSSGNTEFDIGIGPEAVSTAMATIANETTAPASVTFTRPTTYAAGIQLNGATGLPAAGYRGIWIRRTVTAGATAAADTGTIRVEGDTEA
jgi:hypothetical protein